MNVAVQKLALALAAVPICAVLLQAQVRETTPAKTTGTISGSVTSSTGDLPNATVFVTTIGAAVPPRSTVINNDGTFRFDDLEIGVYRVWASAPGFVTDGSSNELRNTYQTGASVNLTLRKGGVITGKVVNSNNTPAVATNVRAFRIRDENGKAVERVAGSSDRMTDDRGIYRIYGLLPGTYIVSAGGMSRFFTPSGATANDQTAATYAPSSTRDTASEVIVRSSDETIIDIELRGEPGHAISGTVGGIPQADGIGAFGGTVSLIDVKSRTALMNSPASAGTSHAFAFYGVPDGEYELTAQHFSQSRDARASEPKRIRVKGEDITGLMLVVAPLPAISGRVILDTSVPADCVRRRETAFQETVVTVRRQKLPPKKSDPEPGTETEPVPLMSVELTADAVPDSRGDFVLHNLRNGTYRLNVRLPGSAWYLRTMSLNPATKASDSRIISDGIGLKARSISGLTITMAEGASALRGQLTVAEGERLPKRAIVYLVPAEKENATNLLRYFETVAADGNFAITNVPPGDYFVVGLPGETDRAAGTLVREDLELRGLVTREAEKSKQTVSLKPCQRLDNYEVPLSLTNKP